MRRDINWTTRRDDGTKYEVRVTWFSGTFKLQFKESGRGALWEYDRKPTRDDLETFLDSIERRYQRRTATYKELEEARRIVAVQMPADLPAELPEASAED